jgi:hypothetical protein
MHATAATVAPAAYSMNSISISRDSGPNIFGLFLDFATKIMRILEMTISLNEKVKK